MLKNILSQKGLSNREIEVADLVVLGLSNQEIADKLCVTPKTIKFHLTSIYKKVNLKSRAQFIVWSIPHLNFVNKDMATVTSHENVAPATAAKTNAPRGEADSVDSGNDGTRLYSGNQVFGDSES